MAQPPPGGWRGSAALLQRGQLVVLALLVLLTIAAWGLTIMQAQSMSMSGMSAVEVAPAAGSPPAADMDDMPGMTGMDDMPAADGMAGMDGMAATDDVTTMPRTDAPGMPAMGVPARSLGALGAFVVAWAVMMVAMMLPAVSPMLLLYRTIAGRSMTAENAFAATWLLVAGYFLVWTAVGVGVFALIRLGGELAGRFGLTGQERWPALALGAILVIAGVYQFTPLKHVCLRQCQSPFGFIMGHWRDGHLGALRMGIVHGAYCLGCCWALFAVLVAAGVMSLAWMLLLTLVVFAEKVLPGGRRVSAAVGAALLALGVLVASGAIGMPWVA